MDLAVSFLSRYIMTKELLLSLSSKPGRKARVFIMGFPGVDHTPELEVFDSY